MSTRPSWVSRLVSSITNLFLRRRSENSAPGLAALRHNRAVGADGSAGGRDGHRREGNRGCDQGEHGCACGGECAMAIKLRPSTALRVVARPA
eukprot:6178616-Pleurochrysis_carterae.AAC.2